MEKDRAGRELGRDACGRHRSEWHKGERELLDDDDAGKEFESYARRRLF